MVRRITILSFLTLLLIAFFGSDVLASFRCGREIARVGDTTMEVLLKCGPPTFKEVKKIVTEGSHGKRFPYGRGYDEVTQIVETWYYNCGPHKFIKILTFRGGILENIDVGNYGSGESDCIGAERRKQREESRPHPGETEDLMPSRNLGYGRISIFGHPHFAEVYLDGKYVGDTPFTLENVEPGAHDIRVKKEEYENWQKRVIVKPGETSHLEVYLDFRW
jgi:hypothetical protein